MKTSLYKLSLLLVTGSVLILSPIQSSAQEKKNENAAEKSGGSQGDAKKAPNPNRAIPFRGKVDAVDKDAKTVKVGTRVFQVTADTKIQKDGKDGKLSDATVGEPVTGSYRQSEDGKLTAVSLRFGQRAADAGPAESEQPAPPEKPSKRGVNPNPKADEGVPK